MLMFVGMTTLSLQPGHGQQVEAILQSYQPVATAQPGFRGTLLLADHAGALFVGLTAWASRAEAEAVTALVRDAVERDLGAWLSAPPMTTILEFARSLVG
jgi:heme-degrading monooxygenase HmoA